MSMTSYDGDTPLHFACTRGHLSLVTLLTERDYGLKSIHVTNNYGRTPLQMAAYFGRIDITCVLLSMIPSSESQQDALKAAQRSNNATRRDTFTLAISQLPVVEWQRQLGLQDEYLSVERTLLVLAQQDSPIAHANPPSLCVLVLSEDVRRQTRLHFQMSQLHDRAIPPHSLKCHERQWHEKYPM